jgi:hypothetical protein
MVHHALKSYIKDYADKIESQKDKSKSTQTKTVAAH